MTTKQELEEKIARLNKQLEECDRLLDDVPVLRGKAAEDFIAYNNRERTEAEIKDLEDAEKYYLTHGAESIKNTYNQRVVDLLKSDSLNGTILAHIMRMYRGKISGEVFNHTIDVMKQLILERAKQDV